MAGRRQCATPHSHCGASEEEESNSSHHGPGREGRKRHGQEEFLSGVLEQDLFSGGHMCLTSDIQKTWGHLVPSSSIARQLGVCSGQTLYLRSLDSVEEIFPQLSLSWEQEKVAPMPPPSTAIPGSLVLTVVWFSTSKNIARHML